MTNLDYARKRAIAVQNYLRSRGVKLKGVSIKVMGPAKKYRNKLSVIIVWTQIVDKEKQEQREAERRGDKIDP